MNITKQEAEASLADIQNIIQQTRRAIRQGVTSLMLIVWGVIWVIGYSTTQFLPQWSGTVWLSLIIAGTVLPIFIRSKQANSQANANSQRIGIFWLVLFGYAIVWVNLLHSGPIASNEDWGRRMGAFFATVPMFAYVVGGLWLGRFFVWLGLIVTALTLLGFFLLPAWFHLWMAFTGGGSLIVAGVFIRKFWR